MLTDRVIHRVWSEIQFSRPGNGTVLELDLAENCRINKRCEHTCFWRVY